MTDPSIPPLGPAPGLPMMCKRKAFSTLTREEE